jgi:hypothetical protein
MRHHRVIVSADQRQMFRMKRLRDDACRPRRPERNRAIQPVIGKGGFDLILRQGLEIERNAGYVSRKRRASGAVR